MYDLVGGLDEAYSHAAIILRGGTVCERLSIGVLAVPHSRRLTIRETDHVVLPVANMVSNVKPNIDTAEVESVEVEVESVDIAVSVVVDDDCAAKSAVRLARCIGSDTIQVRRVGVWISVGRQVDVRSAEVVEIVQIV